MTRRLVAPALLLFALAAPARLDARVAVVLSGGGGPSGKRLDDARKLLAARKTGEGLALLQAVIDSGGNDLVAVGANRAVSARRLAHAQIARLSLKGLWQYRLRAEP